MLFEEFVQQHCVHRVVAHRVDLTFVIAHNQVGVHLRYVFGNQPELRHRVIVTFVDKSDRLQLENTFTQIVHWRDRVLVTARGGGLFDAQLPVAVDIDRKGRVALLAGVNA